MTPQARSEALAIQNDRCAICGVLGELEVDHDHETGTVRGFLCSACNNLLGLVHDDPEILERMAQYLESCA